MRDVKDDQYERAKSRTLVWGEDSDEEGGYELSVSWKEALIYVAH